jgi:hypothetical protein
MTPLEIFEYKFSWLPGFVVTLHSDLELEGKRWCRKNIEQHLWSFTSYSDIYEHTFYFQKAEHAQQFEQEFSRWTQL